MKILNEKELKGINGGWSITSILGIGSIFAFFIGLVDGYIRPLSCR